MTPLLETYKNLFPTTGSFLVFVTYIALFVNQGLLVTASQQENHSYDYNFTLAVLCSEFIKFIISIFLYNHKSSCYSMILESVKYVAIGWLYFLPAVLYCLYNNLSYMNLEIFDPTTYFILLQLRVLVTALIFQFMFKRELSRKQWLSLLILTFGCMIKQFKFGDTSADPTKVTGQQIGLSHTTLLIGIQILCSCLAGVYNEYLLKFKGLDVNIYLQNAFMYFDSIVCNILFMLISKDYPSTFAVASFSKLLDLKVMLVILNNAVLGIVTSFFLKSLNSILKNFASALELIFTAVLSLVFFAIPIGINTALSITLIIIASVLYSQSPVKNYPASPSKTVTSDCSSKA